MKENISNTMVQETLEAIKAFTEKESCSISEIDAIISKYCSTITAVGLETKKHPSDELLKARTELVIESVAIDCKIARIVINGLYPNKVIPITKTNFSKKTALVDSINRALENKRNIIIDVFEDLKDNPFLFTYDAEPFGKDLAINISMDVLREYKKVRLLVVSHYKIYGNAAVQLEVHEAKVDTFAKNFKVRSNWIGMSKERNFSEGNSPYYDIAKVPSIFTVNPDTGLSMVPMWFSNISGIFLEISR